MDVREVLDLCVSLMEEDMDKGTTVELFKPMYPYPFDDMMNIVANIQRIDEPTTTTLIGKIDSAFMDLRRSQETIGEAFMFRLRLENAIRMLTILSKGKVPVELKTTICEEAAAWSMTTLWTACSDHWACLTAQALCAGLPSALPWPRST